MTAPLCSWCDLPASFAMVPLDPSDTCDGRPDPACGVHSDQHRWFYAARVPLWGLRETEETETVEVERA